MFKKECISLDGHIHKGVDFVKLKAPPYSHEEHSDKQTKEITSTNSKAKQGLGYLKWV